MKLLIIISLIIGSLSAFATLKEGVYKGTIGKNTDARLYINKYPGRVGSYMAIIMSENKRTHVYLVDPRSANKFGMVPLNAIKNAVIGMKNSIPSLSLTMSSRKGKRVIRITPNNSLAGKVGNNLGFKQGMTFKADTDVRKRSMLVPSIIGNYKVYSSGTHKVLSRAYRNMEAYLSEQFDNEAALQMDRGLDGDYILREVRPSLHLPLRSSMTESVEMTSQNADFMVFFLQRRCLFGTGNYMIMVKTDGSGQTITLKQKN